MLKKLFLSAVLCTASMVAMAQSQIITHVVQRGETLESIAKYYNISVADLNNANPNADGIIYVGMKLAVPVMAAATTTTSTVASEMATNLSETSNINQEAETQRTVSTSQTSTYTSESSDYKYTDSSADNNLGFQFARSKASYLFPTQFEKSERNHYRARYNILFDIECEYVFKHNIYIGFGLGYMGQGSVSSDRIDGNYSQFQSSFNYITLPTCFGYRIPLTKHINFDIYTGPVFAYTVSGYYKTKTSTYSDWDKTKLSDMKNVNRFSAFWNVGARINIYNIEIGAEYWHSLSKAIEGNQKGGIAICFGLHV